MLSSQLIWLSVVKLINKSILSYIEYVLQPFFYTDMVTIFQYVYFNLRYFLYNLFVCNYNQFTIILTCFHACDHNPLQTYHNYAEFNIFYQSIQ